MLFGEKTSEHQAVAAHDSQNHMLDNNKVGPSERSEKEDNQTKVSTKKVFPRCPMPVRPPR